MSETTPKKITLERNAAPCGSTSLLEASGTEPRELRSGAGSGGGGLAANLRCRWILTGGEANLALHFTQVTCFFLFFFSKSKLDSVLEILSVGLSF